MVMAAQPKSPVARLVVNDVGPDHRAGGARADPRLLRTRPDVRDLRRDRSVHPHGFGAVRAPDRRAVGARHAHQRPAAAGRPLGAGLRSGHRRAVPGDAQRRRTSGALWDAIRCPTLVLRGAQSDLLSAATAAEMARRGPRPAVDRVRGCRPRADAASRRADRPRRALSPILSARPAGQPICGCGRRHRRAPRCTFMRRNAVPSLTIAVAHATHAQPPPASIRKPANPPETRPAQVVRVARRPR